MLLDILDFISSKYSALQTCNGVRQSPIDVDFTSATPVDDSTSTDANGALKFENYNTVRTFIIENTVEHYEDFEQYQERLPYGIGRADNENLKNKGGHTVVSKITLVSF